MTGQLALDLFPSDTGQMQHDSMQKGTIAAHLFTIATSPVSYFI